jgi:predicted nucleotidyltransferase
MAVSTKKTLDNLLVSKVRVKTLKYFFFNPDVPIHLRGAARELNEEINAVRREMNRMEDVKLLKSEKRGNRKYFSLNFDHPFFNELLSLVHKTFGLGGAITRHENKIGDIEYAILTRSYTRGIRMGTHDVDLVVVGDIELAFLSDLVEKEEDRIEREINYTVLTNKEFKLRKKRRDNFVMELLLSSKTIVLGDEEELLRV